MAINRRRAASSSVSREKKIAGHRNESVYADLIGGEVIIGTQKPDVKDNNDFFYSVKSGKKWQVFLYRHDRIETSTYLNILKPCLDAFPKDYELYLAHRTRYIEYKESHIKKFGREATKDLTNSEVLAAIGNNEYFNSKVKLATATSKVCNSLVEKAFLRNFLAEAIFNNDEVDFLAVIDTTYEKDNVFKTFHRDDVLDVFSRLLSPSVSQAGYAPEDLNIAGQKTLLRYKTSTSLMKNAIEIEIRNDSAQHYREVRFNMYSSDALNLLLNNIEGNYKIPSKKLHYYGLAAKDQA
jgi:hypothetical protein